MATVPDVIPMTQASDWFGVLKQYGLATLISIGAVIYLGFLSEMNRRAQQKFTDSIAETNGIRAENEKKQTEIQSQNAQSQAQTAQAVDRMSRAVEESNRFQQRLLDAQQQLLDATRRGAWLEHRATPTPVPREGDGCSIAGRRNKIAATRLKASEWFASAATSRRKHPTGSTITASRARPLYAASAMSAI